MPKTPEVKRIPVSLEDILTPKEAKVLQLADREVLLCPRCKQPLSGRKIVEEGMYDGILLICLEGCGFREY